MIELKQGDCLDLMRDIPAKSIDLILCDLPYGITQCKWDTVIPFEPLWERYKGVIKDNGAIILFGCEPFSSSLRMSNSRWYKYDWTWYKHYARGFLNAKKQPLRTTESICVFYQKQCTYKPEMRKGKMRGKGNSAKQRGCYNDYARVKSTNDLYYPTTILDFPGVAVTKLTHPTQKPVALLEYLIKTYTNEGETVLDNCMGSGSTGVACVNTNRNFIGFELDNNYFGIAQERIKKAQSEYLDNLLSLDRKEVVDV